MKGLDVKSFDDLKDVFKLMVGEMLENGLEGELDDELGSQPRILCKVFTKPPR